MTQSEINAKAMADIFALEDSKNLFEAIGDLNDDQGMGIGTEPEYGPDDMLTVIPGSPDTFGGQSVGAPVQEPSADDKRFVVDSFAEKMANAHKTIVDEDSIDTFSPIIQQEAGPKINVRQFLTDMMNSATQRLSSQNVSEAQPTGATPEDSITAPTEGAGTEMDPMAAADPMGTPAMDPAAGGIAPEPSLDANAGDPMAAGDDLGLDGITDDGMGDFGAEPAAPEGGDDLGLDGITDDGLGGEGDLGAEGEPAGEDDLGLGGITDDGLGGEGDLGAEGEGDLGGDVGGEGDLGAESEGDVGGEGDVLGDSNLDGLSDDTFGSDDDGEKDSAIPEEETDADFEAEMTAKKAQLESIYSNYVEDRARRKIRSMVESYVAKKDAEAAKKAQFEAAETKKVEETAEAKRAELGSKVAGIVESAKDESRAAAMLEAAKRAFVKKEASAKKDKELDSMLESIAANYHKVQAEKKATGKLQAKLESISKKYAPKPKDNLDAKLEAISEKHDPAKKAMTESVQPKKTGLNAQLQEIIDSL